MLFEFMDFDYLSDGEIELIIEEKADAYEPKGYLPAYKYKIRLHNSKDRIGRIDIRIGHNRNTYYGGNIGYEIEEAYRGHHYAAKACRLVKKVAEAHGMDKVIITNSPSNIPSRKTCENLGARLLEIVDLPEDNEMYQLGDRQKCRYEWMIGKSKAVFLDLQGTLGGDGIGDISDFEFFTCSIEAIKLLNENGILAIIVTNQSHIAKGILTMSDFNNKVEILKKQLNKENTYLDAVYCCPHGRYDNCQCKKPLTGMVLQAQTDFNINLEECYVIGDMGMSDMVMAKAVGARAILVRTGVGEGSLTDFRHTWSNVEPDYIAENVLEAVKWIVKRETLLNPVLI
jgi:D,D-heptose 1,7-bisphosphate phosphatase